jgi:hypothetical protein
LPRIGVKLTLINNIYNISCQEINFKGRFYFLLSKTLAAIITKIKEATMIIEMSRLKGKSWASNFFSGKTMYLNASIPYVSGLIIERKPSIWGSNFTGYIAPDKKNMGITMKFIMTLKLSKLS